MMSTVCDYCGAKVHVFGKGPHFKDKHPEFKFHLARDRSNRRTNIMCDVCGTTVASYKHLVLHHKHEQETQGGQQEVPEVKAGRLAALVLKGECVCEFRGSGRAAGLHRSRCARWVAEMREAMPEIIEQAKANLESAARRYSMSRDTLCVILHRRGIRPLTPGVAAVQHTYLAAAQRYDPQPVIQRSAPRGIPQLVEQLLNEGRDPRHELWDAIWESQSTLKEKARRLEADLASANAELTALREERAENERLRIINRQLIEAGRARMLEQVKGSLATPGEGSLVSRP